MIHKIKVAVCTHIGNSRENQEDSVIVVCNGKTVLRNSAAEGDPESRDAYFQLPGEGEILIAVSDGMGGHLGGETASGYTVSYLEKNARALTDAKANVPPVLEEMISKISENVTQLARRKEACRGMGATLSGLYAGENMFCCFHAGDSRIYQYADGVLTQLTKDHTEGQRLMDLGLLTEEEAKALPHGKSIYKYIGMRGALHADVIHMSKVAPGSVFLLCTDGLTDALFHADMQEILKRKEPLEAKRERFLREALGRRIGFGDNISFVLVEF